MLGVNGYVWISRHVEPDDGGGDDDGALGRMDETVSHRAYASQNDAIDAATFREIARFRSVVLALVQHGLPVDEDTVTRAYAAAVDMAAHAPDDIYLGGDRGRRLVAALSGS
ncbi:hypothetical protein CDD83_5087 [Cordyceps sp. RAO-2017]|nr:hypothetical protein CDD83_5087 [Cordyceps sp. RAO-2017]